MQALLFWLKVREASDAVRPSLRWNWRGSNLRYRLNAQGWVQILPSLSDQRLILLDYPLTFMIQGWVLLLNPPLLV